MSLVDCRERLTSGSEFSSKIKRRLHFSVLSDKVLGSKKAPPNKSSEIN